MLGVGRSCIARESNVPYDAHGSRASGLAGSSVAMSIDARSEGTSYPSPRSASARTCTAVAGIVGAPGARAAPVAVVPAGLASLVNELAPPAIGSPARCPHHCAIAFGIRGRQESWVRLVR